MPAATARVRRRAASGRDRAHSLTFCLILGLLLYASAGSVAAQDPSTPMPGDGDGQPGLTEPDDDSGLSDAADGDATGDDATGDDTTDDDTATSGDGDGDATGDAGGNGTTGDATDPASTNTNAPPAPRPGIETVRPLPEDRDAVRAARLLRPLGFSRNTALDFLPNLPRLDTAQSLPAGWLGLDITFDWEFGDTIPLNDELWELNLTITYAWFEGFEFSVGWGIRAWDGNIGNTALGISGAVNTDLGMSVSDMVIGIKYQFIRPDMVANLSLAASTEIKLPLGQVRNFTTNSEVDINLSILAVYELDVAHIFAMVGGTLLFDDGQAVFQPARRFDEAVLLSLGAGAAFPITPRLALIAQTEFHTSYRGSENVWTVEGGMRADLSWIGTPWFIDAGFSYSVIGDGDFTILLSSELLFGLPALFE